MVLIPKKKEDNHDADTADFVIQLGLFGDVIFG